MRRGSLLDEADQQHDDHDQDQDADEAHAVSVPENMDAQPSGLMVEPAVNLLYTDPKTRQRLKQMRSEMDVARGMTKRKWPSRAQTDRIVTHVLAGNYAETALAALGFSKQRLSEWRKIGEEAREKAERGEKLTHREADCLYYITELDMGAAICESAAVRDLTKAFDKDWRSVATYLERKNTRMWGRTQKVEMTGEGGGPVRLSIAELMSSAAGELEPAEPAIVYEVSDGDVVEVPNDD